MKIRLTLFLFILISATGFSQDQYDGSFGNNGIFIQPDNTAGATLNLGFQGDDKIIGGSYISSNTGQVFRYLYRINLDGTLDTSFGDNGVFTDDTSNVFFHFPDDILVTDNGIYTVASGALQGADRTDLTVTKLTADGTLDTNFGLGGYAVLPEIANSDFTDGFDIEMDSEGNLIASGLVRPTGTLERYFIVAKFLSNGTIDSSYADDGVYHYPVNPEEVNAAWDMIINDEDEIHVIGNRIILSNYSETLVVFKLTPDGVLDTNYADNGVYTITFDGIRAASGATFLSNNSILIYGFEQDNAFNYEGFSTRINAEGVLDTTYGDNGYGASFYGGPDIVVNYAEMIVSNDEYVLIGDVFDFTINFGTRRVIITKLNPDGTFVSTYGDDGTQFFDSPIPDYQAIRGLSAIGMGNDFYIGVEAELPDFSFSPGIIKLESTPVSVLNIESSIQDISLFPNPVNDATTLQFYSIENQTIELQITNLLGQVMSSRKIETQAGGNTISLREEIARLSDGFYNANLLMNDSEAASIKFIK